MYNDLTIIIPMFAQPNFLATTLYGLVKNSVLKNRIIVVWSDPARQGEGGAKDYLTDYSVLINEGKLKGYQKYGNVQDYMAQNADFIAKNEIEFVDVTEESYEFMLEYKAGLIWKGNAVKPAPGNWEGGQDIAFKDNWGIKLTTSEYVMPNWDADFFPSPGWDEILIRTMEGLPHSSIVVPAQVQPLAFDTPPNWQDAWEECRYIACARLTMPIPQRGGNVVSEQELEDFYHKWARPIVLTERPGVRDRLHHFPVLYRTEELINILGPEHINYQGAGYDLAWDDDAGQKGFMKYTPRDSWCIHKAFPAITPEL